MAEGLAPLRGGAFPLPGCSVLTARSLWILWHIEVLSNLGGRVKMLWHKGLFLEASRAFSLFRSQATCASIRYYLLFASFVCQHVSYLSFVLRHLPQNYGFHDKFLSCRVAL